MRTFRPSASGSLLAPGRGCLGAKTAPTCPPGGRCVAPGARRWPPPAPASPAPPRATFLEKFNRPTLGLRKWAPFGFRSVKRGATSLNRLGKSANNQAPNPKKFGIGSVLKAKTGVKPKIR